MNDYALVIAVIWACVATSIVVIRWSNRAAKIREAVRVARICNPGKGKITRTTLDGKKWIVEYPLREVLADGTEINNYQIALSLLAMAINDYNDSDQRIVDVVLHAAHSDGQYRKAHRIK